MGRKKNRDDCLKVFEQQLLDQVINLMVGVVGRSCCAAVSVAS